MAKLTPIDFDPFEGIEDAGPKLTAVDFDPFSAEAVEKNNRAAPVHRKTELPWFEEYVINPVRSGYYRGKQGINLLLQEVGITDPDPSQQATRLAYLQRQADRYGASLENVEAAQRVSSAESIGAVMDELLENPQVITNTTLESMGMFAPILATTAAISSSGSPMSTAISVGAGSTAVEYSQTLISKIQESGMDPSDPRSWAKAIADTKLMEEAREDGVKRGIAVGLFDMITAGLAGKLLASAKPGYVSPTVRATGEMGLQASGGMAGEASAQLATEGEIKSIGEIALEGFAEIPTAIVETPANIIEARQAAQSAIDQDEGAGSTGINLDQISKIVQGAETVDEAISAATSIVDAPIDTGPVDITPPVMMPGEGVPSAEIAPMVEPEIVGDGFAPEIPPVQAGQVRPDISERIRQENIALIRRQQMEQEADIETRRSIREEETRERLTELQPKVRARLDSLKSQVGKLPEESKLVGPMQAAIAKLESDIGQAVTPLVEEKPAPVAVEPKEDVVEIAPEEVPALLREQAGLPTEVMPETEEIPALLREQADVMPIAEAEEKPEALEQPEAPIEKPIELPEGEIVEAKIKTEEKAAPEKAREEIVAPEVAEQEILTAPKKQFINKMMKEAGYKKDSPGYKQAFERTTDEYEAALDKAEASLSFEEFNARNPDATESMNRQAHTALREQFGIEEESNVKPKPVETPAPPMVQPEVEPAEGAPSVEEVRPKTPQEIAAYKRKVARANRNIQVKLKVNDEVITKSANNKEVAAHVGELKGRIEQLNQVIRCLQS